MNTKKHGGNIYSIVREYGYPAREILDFSVNLNPLGTPAALTKMITDNLNEIMYYPDPEYIECRESIGSYHGLPYNLITAGNGATELIFLYCRVIKPAKAIIVAPAFSEYKSALEAVGASISYFELKEKDEFIPDIDSLKKELQKGYDLAVICNPNNPTGTLLSRKDILSLAETAANSGCRIMVDESFMEFAPGKTSSWSVIDNTMSANIYVIRSLTKIFSMPGLRLGYGISIDGELNSKLAEQKEPWSINVFAAKSTKFLLNDLNYLNETRKHVSEENRFLTENMKNIAWLKTFISPVNYLLLKIFNNMTSSRLCEELLKKKIMVRDASNFMFLNEKFIRIAVKDRESNSRLIDALNDISK